MPTIPYVKQTWTDGVSSYSAARGAVQENGIYEAHLQPAVRVQHSVSQAIVTATDTALAFNTETFDTAAGAAATHHDNVTNNSRLTCLYAGNYLVTANLRFQASALGLRTVWFRLNGGAVIIGRIIDSPAAAGATEWTLTAFYPLAVNDYLQCYVNQTTGGNLDVEAAGSFSPTFGMVRVA